ncbi:MAG: DinB family protein [Caldilineaceae bacterium]
MSTEKRTQIIDELVGAQRQITALLNSAPDAEWRPAPNQWSLRQIAWHLATAEQSCLLTRIQQIATGGNPTFGIYLDTETEFNNRALPFALEQWANARQEVINFVKDLPDEALAYTGYHPSFGPLTILGYLQVFLEHDRRHLAELQQMVVQ